MSENGNPDADGDPVEIDLSIEFSAAADIDCPTDIGVVSDPERLEAFVRKAERGAFGADSDLASAVRAIKLLLDETKTDAEK